MSQYPHNRRLDAMYTGTRAPSLLRPKSFTSQYLQHEQTGGKEGEHPLQYSEEVGVGAAEHGRSPASKETWAENTEWDPETEPIRPVGLTAQQTY